MMTVSGITTHLSCIFISLSLPDLAVNNAESFASSLLRALLSHLLLRYLLDLFLLHKWYLHYPTVGDSRLKGVVRA